MENENLEKMSDEKLRHRIACVGSNIHKWRRQFGALLPEIRRRKFWLKEKFIDLTTYAQIKAAFTPGTVDRVLKVYDRVKNHRPLLALFNEAKVSWSKFEIVLTIIRPNNASLLVERLLNDTQTDLRKYVKAYKAAHPKEFPQKKPRPKPKPETSPDERPKPGSDVDNTEGGDDEQTTKRPMPSASRDGDQGNIIFPGSSGHHDTEAPGEAHICLACGHVAGEEILKVGNRDLEPLYGDPIVNEMYVRELFEWQKSNKKVRMTDVLGAVITYAKNHGLTFDKSGLEADGSFDLTKRKTDRDATSDNETASDNRTSSDGTAPPDRAADEFSETSKDQSANPNTGARLWFDYPYVQVINYDVKTGLRYTKTSTGTHFVREKELEYRTDAKGKPEDLQAIRLKAKEKAEEYLAKYMAAGKDVPDYIPRLIRYYLWLRSNGGYCEFPECNQFKITDHHIRRFAENPSADPDGLICFGKFHDRAAHNGAIANEFESFHELRLKFADEDLNPGNEAIDKIDANYRACRQKAAQGKLKQEGRRKYKISRLRKNKKYKMSG